MIRCHDHSRLTKSSRLGRSSGRGLRELPGICFENEAPVCVVKHWVRMLEAFIVLWAATYSFHSVPFHRDQTRLKWVGTCVHRATGRFRAVSLATLATRENLLSDGVRHSVHAPSAFIERRERVGMIAQEHVSMAHVLLLSATELDSVI
jgi:hypothetical protein